MYAGGRLNKNKFTSFDNIYINLPENEKFNSQYEAQNMFMTFNLSLKGRIDFKVSNLQRSLFQVEVLSMIDNQSFVSIVTKNGICKYVNEKTGL
jgi:hypothetical protein